MKKKRLSYDEIEQARDKILDEFDHYIVRYMKSRKAKNEFQERYLAALKARIDMTNFLHAEMMAIKDLVRREEERLAHETELEERREAKRMQPRKKDFADRIIEANYEKIMKYPDKEIHFDASVEVRRLFGALHDFERSLWPDIERCLRKIAPTLYSGPRIVLERKIFDLWSDSKEGVSPRLAGYLALFYRFPRSPRDIAREEQRFIIDSGYLLHEIAAEIGKVKNDPALEKADRIYLEKMFDFVHTVINDFRLNDFKA